jgi:hypothetical protein
VTYDLGPPNPIPPYLMPLGDPLGDEDLRIVLSSAEVFAIATLIVRDQREKLDAQLMLTHRDGSPWIEIAIAKRGESRRYALWRYTGRIYRQGPDGAVEDDPIEL